MEEYKGSQKRNCRSGSIGTLPAGVRTVLVPDPVDDLDHGDPDGDAREKENRKCSENSMILIRF